MKKAPPHLSTESKKLWRDIAQAYSDFDEYGYLILRTGLEAFDRLQDARRRIDKEGLCYKTKSGYKREHPMLKIEKQARDGFLSAMRLLGLNIELPGDIGRPPGS